MISDHMIFHPHVVWGVIMLYGANHPFGWLYHIQVFSECLTGNFPAWSTHIPVSLCLFCLCVCVDMVTTNDYFCRFPWDSFVTYLVTIRIAFIIQSRVLFHHFIPHLCAHACAHTDRMTSRFYHLIPHSIWSSCQILICFLQYLQ